MRAISRRTSEHGGTIANLIFTLLALGLCGLCLFQFKKEGENHSLMTALSRTNSTVMRERDDALKETARWKDELVQLTKRSQDSESILSSNRTEIAKLRKDLTSTTNKLTAAQRERDGFKNVFEQQKAIAEKALENSKQLKAQAETEIKKAQEQLLEFRNRAEERTGIANDYAKKYQDVVREFERLREELVKQGFKENQKK